jgi:hypothetical protein
VPDYFGENHNAQNYGAVYSAKLASSLVGIGPGSAVINSLGYTGAYWIGTGVALLSAVIVLFLRQPQTPPGAPAATPAAEAAVTTARPTRRPAHIGDAVPVPTGGD